jgi:hypothetical protein
MEYKYFDAATEKLSEQKSLESTCKDEEQILSQLEDMLKVS